MMDYKQMAEIVTKEVDAILERKKRRAILIKRISVTLSGLCAATIVAVGVWHTLSVKPSLKPDDIPVISEITSTSQQTTEFSGTETAPITTTDVTTEEKITSSEATYDNTIVSGTVLSSKVSANVNTSSVATAKTSKTSSVQTTANPVTISSATTAKAAMTTKTSTTLTTSVSTKKAVTSTSYVTTRTSTTRAITTTMPVSTTTRTTTKVTVTTAPYSTRQTTSSTARPIVTTPFVPPQPRTTVSTTGGTTGTTVYIPPTTYTRPTTTTAPTTDIVFSYDITCRVVEEYTYQNVPGVNMRLYEVKMKRAYDGHMINDGKPVLIAEWNTSSTPEFTYHNLTGAINEYAYYIASDKLPEGYNYSRNEKIRSGLGYSSFNDLGGDVKLQKGEPSQKTVDIPLKGTYSIAIAIEDNNNYALLKDLDCEIYDSDSGDIIARWNTSDTGIMHLEGLSYEFDNDDILSGGIGKKVYNIRIRNLPDNWSILRGDSRNDTTLSGDSIIEFENGTELFTIIYCKTQ